MTTTELSSGRLTLVVGGEGAGKTQWCMRQSVRARAQSLPVVWFDGDVSGPLDRRVQRACADPLFRAYRPTDMEHALNFLLAWLRLRRRGLVVFDHLDALFDSEPPSAAAQRVFRRALGALHRSRAMWVCSAPLERGGWSETMAVYSERVIHLGGYNDGS